MTEFHKKILITTFLKVVKKYAKADKLNFWPREKNRAGQRMARQTGRSIKNIILNELTVEDYVSGPLPDHGKYFNKSTGKWVSREGTMWIFAKDIDGVQMYIKLKIEEDIGEVKCISFHPADEEMKRPYYD